MFYLFGVVVTAATLLLPCVHASFGQCGNEVVLQGTNVRYGDFFGGAVAMDGDVIVVGAAFSKFPYSTYYGFGASYVFEQTSPGTWTETAFLSPSDVYFGSLNGISVAIDGDKIVTGAMRDPGGAYLAGAAYVWDKSGGSWLELQKLEYDNKCPACDYGISVAISGAYIVVGADSYDEYGAVNAYGVAYLYHNYIQVDEIHAQNGDSSFSSFGFSLVLEGTRLMIGQKWGNAYGSNSGLVYVWEESTPGTMGYVTTVSPDDASTNQFFGWGMALQGNTLLVGAPRDSTVATDAGCGYIFTSVSAGVWQQDQKIIPALATNDDWIGHSVALDGTILLIGGHNALFGYSEVSPGVWAEFPNEIVTANGHAGDNFGDAIALSGLTVVVGAPSWDAGPSFYSTDYGRTMIISLCGVFCDSSPCLNSATCDPSAGQCICASHFTGQFCQTEIDACDSSPCLNTGDCSYAGVGLFSCDCTDTGFEGDICQTDADDCVSSPCASGGTCTDVGTNAFECTCSLGYTGDTCQSDVDDCASSPCTPMQSRNCIDDGSVPNQFVCTCETGYTGPLCETRIDDCASSPCSSEGTCVLEEPTGYNCTYPPISVDPCSSSPCAADELCVYKTSAGYTCEPNVCLPTNPCVLADQILPLCVPLPLSGEMHSCDNTGCDPDFPCADDEICIAEDNDGYTCVPEPCVSSPCEDGELCDAISDDNGGVTYVCTSPPGPPCHSVTNPCLNDGTCDDDTGVCTCVDWFNGDMCEIDCTVALACGPALDIDIELDSDPSTTDLADSTLPNLLVTIFGGTVTLFTCTATSSSIAIAFPNPGTVDDTNILSLLEPVIDEIDNVLGTVTVSTGVEATTDTITCTYGPYETPTGFCISSPCENGATCDNVNEVCLCAEWTDGSLCELDCRLSGECGPDISITCVVSDVTSKVSGDDLDILTTDTVLTRCVSIFGGNPTDYTCVYTDDTIEVAFPNPGTMGGTTPVVDSTTILDSIAPVITDIDSTCGTSLTNIGVATTAVEIGCHYIDACELDNTCDPPPACDSQPCQNGGVCTSAEGLNTPGYFVYYYQVAASGEFAVISEWVTGDSEEYNVITEMEYLANRPGYECDCTDTSHTGQVCEVPTQPPIVIVCTGFDLPLPETPPNLECGDDGYDHFVAGYLLHLADEDERLTDIQPSQISDLEIACADTSLNVTFVYDPPIDTDDDIFVNIIGDAVPEVQARTGNSIQQVNPPEDNADDNDDAGDGSVGMIIGITVGVLVLIAMTIAVFFMYCKPKQKRMYSLPT